MRRLDNFGHWMRKTGKQAVRVIQLGDETGRVHFHLVSWQRWDVTEMRDALERHGFGRVYDVRERPWSRAIYAARYVGRKPKWKLPRGVRQWGCIGMKGVRAVDVSVTKRSLHLVTEQSDWHPDFVTWVSHADNLVIRLKRREYPYGDKVIEHMNEIKPAQSKQVIAELLRGRIVGVGEYRACDVRSVGIADKKNPAAPKIMRVVVEHSVELGAEAVKVSEWLPAGALESSVKPPANRGETVLVACDAVSSTFGRDRKVTGTVLALTLTV